MDFPIIEILDDELSYSWIGEHISSRRVEMSHCGKGVEEARFFRYTPKSLLPVYSCESCQGIYNLYSGTIFSGSHFRPKQVILLLRGICKGESAASIAREIDVSRQTVHSCRKLIQSNAELLQSEEPLPDQGTETDEMYQNAYDLGDVHQDILTTLQDDGQTNNGGEVLMRMIDLQLGILIVNGQKTSILTSSVSNIQTTTGLTEFTIHKVIFIVRVASFTESAKS